MIMLPFTSEKTRNFSTRVFSLNGHAKVLLFKEDDKLFYRSGVLVTVRPLQIPSLFPLIDFFTHPVTLSLKIHVFKVNNLDSYILVFVIDTDLSDCPKKNYNTFLKSSLTFHQQQVDLLRKNISLKDYEGKNLSPKQMLDFNYGKIVKSLRKYAYSLEFQKEIDIFRNVIFSNNKIKKLDYKRDSIIPHADIILGRTISNKEIGVNSHVFFLTGQKEFRRSIISTVVNHFIQQDDYHIILFDFGLQPSFGKNHIRTFYFDDILFDPFTFNETITSSQHALFISHISFIGKNILRLNDRQIGILEEKLSLFLQINKLGSWNNFLAFVQDEVNDEIVKNTQNIGSFLDDASNSDFTATLKSVDSPTKSNDFESLLNKLRYLDYLFAKADRTSLSDILYKTHLDVFSISTTPDLKSLTFYLFNLFYALNESKYKEVKFMFLDIDSILFDKFNDLDVSWLHPDIKNSLFDSSDIFASKRILNLLETKIFCSYISNAPVALLSKNVKDCIDKLQFLHDYYVLESPTLQRPEFFKLQSEKKESYFDMPDINLFIHLPKLLFSRSIDYSFRQLFALFDIDYKILGKLLRANYLRRHKHSFVLSDKSLELKQVIIDFLSYQPELTLEENDVLIKFSDPIVYNVIFQPEFPFTGNIDILCTRLLANQFINHRLNSFLLYQFLCYKKQLIDDKKLLYFLIVSLQSTTQQFTSINQIEPASNTTDSALLEDFSTISNTSEITQPVNGSKIEIMQDHFPTMKSVLEDPNIKKHENSKVANSVQIPKYPTNIQAIIDRINKRINEVLPDKSISFPENPIFLIMKFLDSNTIELLHNDIENLLNTAREIPA